MEENNFQRTADLLINWSKWLITLSFTSGVGCILAMKTSEAPALQRTGAVFFTAILFFCLSILCSSLFVFLLSKEKNVVGKQENIKGLWLAKLQLVLFAIAILFVLIWIAIFSKVV